MAPSTVCVMRPPDDTRYVQAPDLVWRVTSDRVLLRRVGDHTEHAAADVVGAGALVWLAADQPATIDELADELDLTVEMVVDAVDQLVAARWMVVA